MSSTQDQFKEAVPSMFNHRESEEGVFEKPGVPGGAEWTRRLENDQPVGAAAVKTDSGFISPACNSNSAPSAAASSIASEGAPEDGLRVGSAASTEDAPLPTEEDEQQHTKDDDKKQGKQRVPFSSVCV